MAKKAPLYTALAFLKHRLTAWNTTGEGIHSPYLFELVRFVLRDTNSYYCFADIERRRELLLACEDEIAVLDYGSQGAPEGKRISRRVCDIARTHLERAEVAQVLFRIVSWLGHQQPRPLQIIELGTSLGITTAYLASADSSNRVVTLEGSGELLKIAQGVWRALRLENIEWVEGAIDDTLLSYVRAQAQKAQPVDIAYIDANHTYEATIRYVSALLPLMPEKGILIIDDIHYSEEMEQAWEALKTDSRVTTSMDLYHVGILFLDPHYLKRHYTIRI